MGAIGVSRVNSNYEILNLTLTLIHYGKLLKTSYIRPFTQKPLQGKIVFFLERRSLFIDKGPFNG
jgi:hypothetical protein